MSKVNVLKSTAIIMVITVLSRFIGLFRDLIIANKFGATYVTDAYKASVMIPETLFMIVGLAITTTFLPMLSKVRSEKGKEEMDKFANNIINIILIMATLFFFISIFFSKDIVEIVAGGLSEEAKELTNSLAKIVLINIIFLSLNACFTAILQVNEDFIVPSVLGIFFNLPIILYIIFAKDCNIYGLTIANVVGNLFRVLIQVPSLIKNNFKYKFFISFKDRRVRELLILIVPVIIGAGANSINLMVDKRIVSGISEGAITTLDNGQMIATVINSVFTAAVTAVIYPLLSNHKNRGEEKEFNALLSKAIVYLAIILIPLSAGVLLYSRDVIGVIFYKYSDLGQNLATMSLVGYALGIFFIGSRDVLNATLFSMRQTKVTAKNGIIGVVINIVLSLILSRYIGVAGVAVASSIAMAVTAILLVRELIKLKINMNVKEILNKTLKIFIATLIMSIIVYSFKLLTVNVVPILRMCLGGLVGVVAYLVMLKLLRIKELEEVIRMKLKR